MTYLVIGEAAQIKCLRLRSRKTWSETSVYQQVIGSLRFLKAGNLSRSISGARKNRFELSRKLSR
jgi:hypothetical protein